MKILRTASLGSNFTGSYQKKVHLVLKAYLEPSRFSTMEFLVVN